MFRGRAALRIFGIDSFANDAGTCPRQWILARISRASKGYGPFARGSGGTEQLFLARYRGCDLGSGGTLPRGWRFYPGPQRKGVRGHLAIAFRFDSATWQWIWRAID